ncbi:hypothetical protein J3F84DRAFT_306969 [Trichoderma pleuroticola]
MAAGSDAARMSGHATCATEVRGHGLKTSWRIRTALIFFFFLVSGVFAPLVCGLRFLEASNGLMLLLSCVTRLASTYPSEEGGRRGGVMCINSYRYSCE